MDLAARVNEVVSIEPNAGAIFDRGTWTSWADVQEFISAADAMLNRLGAGRDADVAVVLRNRAAAVALVWAILSTRRCLVTISPMQADEPLAEELRALRAPVVIAYQDDWDRPGIRGAVRLAGAIVVTIADAPLSLEVRGDPAPGHTGTAAGVAVKMLTSGTTGAPRRVEITYRELEQGFESAGVYRRATDDDKPKLRSGATIVALPLSHMSGLWLAVEAAVEGRKVAVLEKFEPREWAQLVREHRPGFANLPPTPIRMVL